MSNIELLKNHAINILGAYADYYGDKNAVLVDDKKVLESLYIDSNKEKYDEIANKVITYLCVYMNIDKESITKEDYMDIKSTLAIKDHIKFFAGNKLNTDYLYDFAKAVYCENHGLSYNDVLDENETKKFNKMYLDAYLDYEFKIYDDLYEEFKELKTKTDRTFEEDSRLENFDKIFLNLPEDIKQKYYKSGEMIAAKEKNFDKDVLSDDNFNLSFLKELMKLYNPINNDKDWLTTIKNYTEINGEYNLELLENIKIAVGNYYATSMISGVSNKVIGETSPNIVSYLDDEKNEKELFDRYFLFYDIGYKKYNNASKKALP